MNEDNRENRNCPDEPQEIVSWYRCDDEPQEVVCSYQHDELLPGHARPQSAPPQKQQKKKKRLGLWIFLGCLAAIAVAVGIGLAVSGGSDAPGGDLPEDGSASSIIDIFQDKQTSIPRIAGDPSVRMTCVDAQGGELTAQEVFAKPEYVGLFNVSIRALSDDPEVFSNSEAQSANSHFASGAGTQGDPFIIDRDGYLRNISTANAKAAGCYYKLTYTPAPGADFEPICSPADPFAGIFDGNGKTIEGWEIRPLADKRNYFGFFGAVAEGAEVASLNFSRCSLYITNDGGSVNKADNGFAWVAGTNNGTLRDIAVTDCTIACETGTTPLNVGGIAANNNGTVLRCTASGAISAAADRNKTDEFTCGGIAAYNYATGVVDQCVNHASITAMNQVGGVVGMNGGKVTGSGNTGAITANYYFGGVVGYTTSSSAACVIEKCYNTGTLTMDEPAGMGRGAAYMGGVTSRIYSNKTVISKCYNTGDLIVGASVSSSSLRIGGIVGHTNKPGRLTDCYNAGNATIKGKANYGGIVGEMADQAAVITNCYTVGKITVDGGSGNLFSAFGKASGKAVITDCYALDNGDAFAGGSTSGITGGGLLSEAQMKNPASYSGWDFVTVWQAGSGSYPYPTLR